MYLQPLFKMLGRKKEENVQLQAQEEDIPEEVILLPQNGSHVLFQKKL